MNKLFLIGIVVADPTMATTPGGTSLCRFDVAADRKGKDKDGKYITDFWKVAVFNEKTAKVCMEWLQKGSKVFIEGESQPNMSEHNGKHYLNNNVVAVDVKFLSPRKEEKKVEMSDDQYDDLTSIDYTDIPF